MLDPDEVGITTVKADVERLITKLYIKVIDLQSVSAQPEMKELIGGGF